MDIFDVAKACNVSKSTISRVINNHPHVSDETRNKVMQYIQENNYVPNNIATFFRNRTTKSVAISIPSINHPFFSKLSSYLTLLLDNNGYKTYIHQTFTSSKSEISILNALKTNEIDAIILCSVENEIDVIESYVKDGLIIACNDALKIKSISNFHFDEEYLGYIAGQYLISLNLNNLGICLDNPDNNAQILRLKGYKKALYVANKTLKDDRIFKNAFTIEDGINIAQYIKTENLNLDGIFTGNDYVSAGIQKVLGDRVKLIGTDNQDICQITTPKLISIEIPIKSMANDIVNHTMQKLVNNDRNNVHKIYDSKIIEN
ncbi:LacI family DNA-binding transcriptional regulator [Macrococcus sp. EM39E]|uniref:LacI family DNA-binding transcriptional regulator n=1 Tax=Macrococcus animalis TaxID=3395467 RepID=UPI0039BDFA5A